MYHLIINEFDSKDVRNHTSVFSQIVSSCKTTDYRIYLDAVAIPRAIGSRKRKLSRVACTKFAPTKPVTTTTAAVRDELAPASKQCGKTSNIESRVKTYTSVFQSI